MIPGNRTRPRSGAEVGPDVLGSGNPRDRTRSRTLGETGEIAATLLYSLEEKANNGRETIWLGGKGGIPLGAVTVIAGNSGINKYIKS